MKVIIADSNPSSMEHFQKMLESEKYHVSVFTDGKAACDAIIHHKEPTHVILNMGSTATQQICHQLVEMHLTHNLHIVACIPSTDSELAAKLIQSGADDVWLQPIASSEFLARLRSGERKLAMIHSLEQELFKMKDALHQRYELKRVIGEGGLGHIYEAWDSALGRYVAIKKFKVNTSIDLLSDDDMWREARITASLNHPNIITVYDCWSGSSGCFVVMELLKGISLEDFVKKHGSISALLFQTIAQQTLSALKIAHHAGVLHCDLKPSNIMLLGDLLNQPGSVQVKLLDFGVAKLIKEIQPDYLKSITSIEGSPLYIAPEVFSGESLDQRSDLYSLGHILYYALTGRCAIFGKTVDAILEAHLEGRFPEISQNRTDLSIGLCDWVNRLMKRFPKDRPQTSQEALDELETLLFEQNQKLAIL